MEVTLTQNQCQVCKRFFFFRIRANGIIIRYKNCPYRDCRSSRWDGRPDQRRKPNGRLKRINEVKKLKHEVKYRCPKCGKKQTKTKSIEKINETTYSFCYCYTCKKDFEIKWDKLKIIQ